MPAMLLTEYAAKASRFRGVVLVLAILAGQAQSILVGQFPNVAAITYVDDSLILLAMALSLPRLGRAPGPPALIAIIWASLCVIALFLTITNSDFGFGATFGLARQLLMPALLVLIGLTFSRWEWQLMAKAVIVLGMLNAVYVGIELTIGHLIDPVPFAQANNYNIYADGLPSTYHGNNFITGERITRAGGLLLNPPTTSLFIGIAAVVAFYSLSRWPRWLLTGIMVLALFGSHGRGGILMVGIAIVIPVLFRWLGALIGTVVVVGGIVALGSGISDHGGSDKHVNGLAGGIADALANPLGRGFGYVGNARDRSVEVDGSGAESLFAIMFSAVGIAGVILVLVAGVGLILKLSRDPSAWPAAVGIGIISASLLVESASAMNGTVPIWILVGIACMRSAPPDEPVTALLFRRNDWSARRTPGVRSSPRGA